MKFFLSIALAIVFTSAQSQIDYPVFKYKTHIDPADSQKLSLNIYNLNYEYNTEWFGKIPLSGTLFGYLFVPELQYQPNKRFVLKAGVYLQNEFGRLNYTTVFPTFSAKINFKHSSFLIGTIEGNLNHQYIEPLYDYKLLFSQRALGFFDPKYSVISPLENGVQFLVDKKHYWQDLYLNWRRAIHTNDPYREEIDLGYSARFKLINNKKFQFEIPIQTIQTHKGGQIANSPDPVQTLFDGALGVSATFKFDNFLKQITTEHFYVNYRDLSGTKRQAFNKGNAYFAHALFKLKHSIDLDLHYWNGSGFIDPRGGPLYQSVSEKIPGFTETKRQLLFLSIIYDKELLKNVNLDFRITPYNDFTEKIFEYAYELYIRYTAKIFLKKIKSVSKTD